MMRLINRVQATEIVSIGLVCLGLAACGTTEQNVVLGTVSTTIAATLLGGQSPNNEVQQIYYLGVFDPQEQVPPTVLRVRVHGQSSFFSFTKFASGWVPAKLIDSLSTGVQFEKNQSRVSITKGGAEKMAALKPGRRLVLFGPEGFREAPADHRLVIVMGSSPEAFFQAIDQSLGTISRALEERRSTKLTQEFFQALIQVKSERERLVNLDKDVAVDLGETK